MSSPIYSNLISALGSQMETITKAFSSDGYQTVMEMVKVPLGTACLLYIILKGFAITLGGIKSPIQELTKSAIKIGLVYTFAMNWGVFSDYFISFFTGFANDFGATMMNISATHFPVPGGVGINNGLQKVLTEIISVGAWTTAKGSLLNVGPLISGIIIYLAGGAIVGLAFFEIVGAKMMMAILFAVAPIVLILALFDQTKQYFDKWLGFLAGFTLVVLLVSGVVGLTIGLLHWSVLDGFDSHASTVGSVGWLPIAFCAFFCMKAVKQAGSLGMSWGGGCSHMGGAEMVGGAMLGAMGMAKTASKAMPNGNQLFNIAKALTPVGSQKMLAVAGSKAMSSVNSIRQKMRGA